MLDPWIIAEIIKREEEQQKREQPRVEMPLESPFTEAEKVPLPPAPESERGVMIIDI